MSFSATPIVTPTSTSTFVVPSFWSSSESITPTPDPAVPLALWLGLTVGAIAAGVLAILLPLITTAVVMIRRDISQSREERKAALAQKERSGSQTILVGAKKHSTASLPSPHEHAPPMWRSIPRPIPGMARSATSIIPII